MFVLPASMTRTLDGIRMRWYQQERGRSLRLHQDQLARTDRDRFRTIAQQRAALLVDAGPGPVHGALADDTGDAIAGLVDGEAPPFGDHAIVIERMRELRVDVLDERHRRILDPGEGAMRHLGDGHRVRPDVVLHRLDVDADADENVSALFLNTRLDQNAGDLAAIRENVVRPLDARVDGEDVAQIAGHDRGHRQRHQRKLRGRTCEHRGRVDPLAGGGGPAAVIASAAGEFIACGSERSLLMHSPTMRRAMRLVDATRGTNASDSMTCSLGTIV